MRFSSAVTALALLAPSMVIASPDCGGEHDLDYSTTTTVTLESIVATVTKYEAETTGPAIKEPVAAASKAPPSNVVSSKPSSPSMTGATHKLATNGTLVSPKIEKSGSGPMMEQVNQVFVAVAGATLLFWSL